MICPLMSCECKKEQCAWWILKEKGCAIARIPSEILGLYYVLVDMYESRV
jgi:hypothetical protein